MTHGLGSLGMNVRNFKHEMKKRFFLFLFHTQLSKCRVADISPCFGPQANFFNLTDSRTREPRIYYWAFFCRIGPRNWASSRNCWHCEASSHWVVTHSGSRNRTVYAPLSDVKIDKVCVAGTIKKKAEEPKWIRF